MYKKYITTISKMVKEDIKKENTIKLLKEELKKAKNKITDLEELVELL